VEGIVDAATGDADAARASLEDAVDLYERSGLVFESAEARLELAHAYRAVGSIDRAVEQAERAHERFDALGASHAAGRASSLLASLRQEGTSPPSPLSAREREILRLVAEGLGDRQIAARLTLSEHTVHRHVANVLTKLDVPSRAAAVARAVAENLI
jgi:DNA-binding NarL/FixJ family response regulator